MAVHIHTAQGSRAIGSHVPLNVALAILPTLPRPLLVRLVANAIDRLDHMDGDADLEFEVTEQDDEPELDDEPEQDDHGGGDVGDEGEPLDALSPAYAIDQSLGPTGDNSARTNRDFLCVANDCFQFCGYELQILPIITA